MKNLKSSFIVLLAGVFFSCNTSGQAKKSKDQKVNITPASGKAIAAFAEGCFWCSEHIFEEIAGVDSAVSGYAGGHKKNPTYEEVCAENTGHAESILVYYDPKIVSYPQLLDAFFSSHDPTTLNRQGPDVGESYRSAIFYLNEEQKQQAKEAVKRWTPKFKNSIVTEIGSLKAFYRAEEYHQNYTVYNPGSTYIQRVSIPRFEKFKRECKLKLKDK
jgi:peptide-methionine (S)-S-oxide reductase